MTGRPIEVPLVQGRPSDSELTVEALRDAKSLNSVSVVEDGIQAMQFLGRQDQYTNAPCPDLISLDLNLPRAAGREALAECQIEAEDVEWSRPELWFRPDRFNANSGVQRLPFGFVTTFVTWLNGS